MEFWWCSTLLVLCHSMDDDFNDTEIIETIDSDEEGYTDILSRTMNGEETIEHGTKEEAHEEGRGKKIEVTNLRNTGSKIIKTSPNSNHNNKSSI